MMLRSALALASRAKLSILIFHRVLSRVDPLLPSEPTGAQFDELLRHIKTRFNVLTLAESARRLYAGTLPSRALALTFDDGYADNLTVAAPILHRHGVPATIFIATRYLDGGCMWNDLVIEAFRLTDQSELDLSPIGLGKHRLASTEDRRSAIDNVLRVLKYVPRSARDTRAQNVLHCAGVPPPGGLMLNREAVRSLLSMGLEVGAHTVSHPILAKMSPADAWCEIRESKQDLERLIGRPVLLFAYPNGRPSADYTAEHVRMVREAGFTAAVSTAWGAASRASDPLQLPRFTPWSREPLKFDLLILRNLCQGSAQRAA